MVIYIDNSIARRYKENAPCGDEIVFFGDLVSAHRKGNCYLCGDASSIEYIQGVLTYPLDLTCKEIRYDDRELGSIIESVECVLVLSYDRTPKLPKFIGLKSLVCNLPLVLNYKLHYECALVAENNDDCKLYELIAKWYIGVQRIRGVNVSFSYTPGGGSTIVDSISNCLSKEKRPTLCLVDTDKLYSGCLDRNDLGDTAKDAKEAFEALQTTLDSRPFKFDILPAHEAENLIPLSILARIVNEQVLSSQQEEKIQKLLSCLNRMLMAGYREDILWFNFKEGIDCSKVNIQRWSEIERCAGDLRLKKCRVILETAVSLLERLSQSNVNWFDAVQIDDYLRPLWERIGLTVFSWGCATTPVRS